MPGFDPQGEDTTIRDSLAMRQLGTTVSPKDVDKALKPYKLDDVKVKGKSDEQLYNMAEASVVKWWQRQQRQKITSRDPGKENTKSENQALQKMNTKVEKALGKIPALNLAAQRRAEERALEARQMKRELLQGTGLWGVDPPDYAMTSVKNLRAWIKRQQYRRRRLAEAREAYLR